MKTIKSNAIKDIQVNQIDLSNIIIQVSTKFHLYFEVINIDNEPIDLLYNSLVDGIKEESIHIMEDLKGKSVSVYLNEKHKSIIIKELEDNCSAEIFGVSILSNSYVNHGVEFQNKIIVMPIKDKEEAIIFKSFIQTKDDNSISELNINFDIGDFQELINSCISNIENYKTDTGFTIDSNDEDIEFIVKDKYIEIKYDDMINMKIDYNDLIKLLDKYKKSFNR